MKVERIRLAELTPDPDNAKDHPAWQVEQIKASIEQFGNLDPIGVWGPQNLIVEGHGRYEALKELGYQEAEVIRLDQLTDEERRAYALAHNQTTLTSGFDPDLLKLNLDSIGEIDMSLFGFRSSGDWFTDRERNDTSRQEGNDEYNEFLDKFEQPKTTDDCYTPDNIYEVVADFVADRYGKSADNFVRPFYPGGDYQAQRYKPTDVVVDNPPFSILAEIVDFYIENGVSFFLFAPALAALNYCKRDTVAAICLNASITYENGASVTTNFITNMEPPEIIAYTDPDFMGKIEETNDINEKAMRKSLPKYDYPYEVLTAAKMGWLAKYGQKLTYTRQEAIFIRALDAQKEQGVGIYGGALLLSERAAAERAAAERAAAERAAATVWKLSDRELEIVKGLGEHHGQD